MIPVTCAIVKKDNYILVTQRSEHMSLPLTWEFPGGKVEPGESEEGCIIRELHEELNIEISIESKLDPQPYRYPNISILLIPFVAKYVSGEIRLHEHKDYRWLKREQLENLEWAPADVPVINAFFAYEQNI